MLPFVKTFESTNDIPRRTVLLQILCLERHDLVFQCAQRIIQGSTHFTFHSLLSTCTRAPAWWADPGRFGTPCPPWKVFEQTSHVSETIDGVARKLHLRYPMREGPYRSWPVLPCIDQLHFPVLCPSPPSSTPTRQHPVLPWPPNIPVDGWRSTPHSASATQPSAAAPWLHWRGRRGCWCTPPTQLRWQSRSTWWRVPWRQERI